MPDDSCRTCGGELAKHSRCSKCKKTIQKICIMCNLKTHKELHMQCIKLDSIQVNTQTSTKSQMVFYKKSKNLNKKRLQKTLKISSLIVLVLTGLAIANYINPMSQNIPVSDNENLPSIEPNHKTQDVILTSNAGTDIKPDNSFKPQYVNCLGISDGNSLTINCPTDYGMVYKAIVEIPNDLVLQFESKVFHMRNFSVLESSDHLLIMYQKQMYITTFVVN